MRSQGGRREGWLYKAAPQWMRLDRVVRVGGLTRFTSGATLTSMRVLPWPERHGSIRWVSFESRKGTCELPAALEAKTPASAESDLLMAWASLRAAPSAPERSSRSEPARSTRWRAPWSSVLSCQGGGEWEWQLRGGCVGMKAWKEIARVGGTLQSSYPRISPFR